MAQRRLGSRGRADENIGRFRSHARICSLGPIISKPGGAPECGDSSRGRCQSSSIGNQPAMMFVFEDEESVNDSASLSHRGLWRARRRTKVVANRPTAAEQNTPPLAERIRAGDAAAERELVEEYSRGVKVILRLVGADAFAVDDLHQETFRIALEKIRAGELRDAARLSGFIASLARNLATDYFRRGTRSATSDSAALESVQSLEALALDRIAASEQARRVRQVLAELRTERDREILRRFYL